MALIETRAQKLPDEPLGKDAPGSAAPSDVHSLADRHEEADKMKRLVVDQNSQRNNSLFISTLCEASNGLGYGFGVWNK
ncbi:hypothetical protein GGC47_004560 [Bosea sp. OAE752]